MSSQPGKPTNGILPMPTTVLQNKSTPAPRGTAPRKPTPPRLKVVLRRLPPGLAEAEFWNVVGEEWRVGAGKVDWFAFKEGKISTDAAKPSRPTRAYLHLTEQAHLQILSEKVQQANFSDAKNTSKDHALLGPPVLEFAAYNRIPVNKKRTDRHQGTIDQEPDFIEFLQSLTNPIQKPSATDIEQSAVKEKVKTTPLIEHIREKKAAKDKPSAKALGKHGRQEGKEAKGDKDKKGGGKGSKEILSGPEKGKRLTKAEKAAKEAVKVLNREASGSSQSAEKGAPSGSPAAERRRERAPNPISVAAKIQRDLGLAPAGGRRAKREQSQSSEASQATSKADGSASTAAAASPSKREPRAPKPRRVSKPTPADNATAENSTDAIKQVPIGPAQPTILKKPPAQQQAPKGPAAARVSPLAPKGNAATTGTTSEPGTSNPNTPSTAVAAGRQAFLKHANPSQGITEPLIEEALAAFGAIEKVEIDRKKGFAYVDFADAEGLRNAIAGSPVKIAQGAVQVLKRHEKPAGRAAAAPMPVQRGGFRGSRGGRGRGGRGGMAAPASAATATPATAAPTAPTASSGPAT